MNTYGTQIRTRKTRTNSGLQNEDTLAAGPSRPCRISARRPRPIRQAYLCLFPCPSFYRQKEDDGGCGGRHFLMQGYLVMFLNRAHPLSFFFLVLLLQNLPLFVRLIRRLLQSCRLHLLRSLISNHVQGLNKCRNGLWSSTRREALPENQYLRMLSLIKYISFCASVNTEHKHR